MVRVNTSLAPLPSFITYSVRCYGLCAKDLPRSRCSCRRGHCYCRHYRRPTQRERDCPAFSLICRDCLYTIVCRLAFFFKIYLSPSKISVITNGPLNFGSSLVWFLFSFLRGTKSPRLNLTTLALFLSNLFLLYWALLSMFYTACCLTSGISTSFSLILSGSNRSYGLAVLPISSCKGLELVTRLVVQFNASCISPIASCHGRPVVSTVVNVFSMYA